MRNVGNNCPNPHDAREPFATGLNRVANTNSEMIWEAHRNMLNITQGKSNSAKRVIHIMRKPGLRAIYQWHRSTEKSIARVLPKRREPFASEL